MIDSSSCSYVTQGSGEPPDDRRMSLSGGAAATTEEEQCVCERLHERRRYRGRHRYRRNRAHRRSPSMCGATSYVHVILQFLGLLRCSCVPGARETRPQNFCAERRTIRRDRRPAQTSRSSGPVVHYGRPPNRRRLRAGHDDLLTETARLTAATE